MTSWIPYNPLRQYYTMHKRVMTYVVVTWYFWMFRKGRVTRRNYFHGIGCRKVLAPNTRTVTRWDSLRATLFTHRGIIRIHATRLNMTQTGEANDNVSAIYALQYGISQLTSHQCSRALADCRDVISIVATSSKYVGNFDRRSNLTWSF